MSAPRGRHKSVAPFHSGQVRPTADGKLRKVAEGKTGSIRGGSESADFSDEPKARECGFIGLSLLACATSTLYCNHSPPVAQSTLQKPSTIRRRRDIRLVGALLPIGIASRSVRVDEPCISLVVVLSLTSGCGRTFERSWISVARGSAMSADGSYFCNRGDWKSMREMSEVSFFSMARILKILPVCILESSRWALPLKRLESASPRSAKSLSGSPQTSPCVSISSPQRGRRS